MEFLVLGPIAVRSAGSPIHVGGVKQRSILALLIANRGSAVSTDRIVLDIYGEDAAPGARRSVQSLVSVLRSELGDAISSSRDGYVLDVPREAVDVTRFEDGVAAGIEALDTDPVQAAALFRDAFELWRGDPYPDVDGRGVFEPEIVRLTELRLIAIEARIEADLACGRHREVVGELEALTLEFPLRERLRGLWMLALYRCGRQAEALETYQQLRNNLGEELGLEPSTELRDLEEQILLQDPGLDLVSPVPHNLPAQLTSFVGRDLELIEIGEALADKRLVTLTGAGGSGKTRLAVELGRRMVNEYPDGVWFVDFRGVDAGGVASLIVSTLQVVMASDRPVVEQLVDALWSRRLLLVLDNCEHVLDGVAPFVELLLRRGGVVRVLATSRQPLGIPGESLMLASPLPLPESADMGSLLDCDAAVLLADRGRSANPRFTMDEHVESVFGICRTVDGLPLALELAAARLRVLSPEELAERLDDQLTMLRTTLKAGDVRHATIEATILWSWDLLNDAERRLLGRLSVFRGTWSLAAAEAICGFEPLGGARVADLVGSLAEKSLVVVEGVAAGSTRYRLLEPIRQFAAGKLNDQATRKLQSRLVDYWSNALAGSYEPEHRFAWRDHDRARSLEADQANLTAAVEWALASDRFEDAMRVFASPYGDLLMLQGSGFEPASRWVDAALEHRNTIPSWVLLSALEVAGSVAETARRFGAMLDYAAAGMDASLTREERRWFELAWAEATQWSEGHSENTNSLLDRIVTEADDSRLRASALLARARFETPKQAWTLTQQALELSPIDSLGFHDECVAGVRIFHAAWDIGQYDVATQMAQRTLDWTQSFGWLTEECQAAGGLALLYAARGRLDEAATLINEALPAARRILGPTAMTSLVPSWAASIFRLQGEFDTARHRAEEALRAADANIGVIAQVDAIEAIRQSALIARDAGDLDQAYEALRDGLRRLADLGHPDYGPWFRTLVHTARASVELRTGDPDRALQDLRTVLGADPHARMHPDTLEAVDLAAIACAQQGRAEVAARLKGAVDRERDECGLVIQPPDAPLREAAMRHAQIVHEGDWEATVTEGRAMTLDEAVELARVEASRVGEAQADVGLEDH